MSNYYQTQMRLETDRVLNGSQTPFKDTLRHGFETTSNLLAITANATAVGRIQSRAWLLESCAEANLDAIKHDQILADSSLFAKLQAQEVANAVKAEGGIQ